MREDNNDNDGAGEAMAQVDDDDGDLVQSKQFVEKTIYIYINSENQK